MMVPSCIPFKYLISPPSPLSSFCDTFFEGVSVSLVSPQRFLSAIVWTRPVVFQSESGLLSISKQEQMKLESWVFCKEEDSHTAMEVFLVTINYG